MSDVLTGAEDVRWDLSDLHSSDDGLTVDLEKASRDADAFSERYRERVAALAAPELQDALISYEAIQDTLGRAYTYAFLNWSTATDDAARGALLQRVRESYTQIAQKLIFFELEWARADDDHAAAVIDAEELAGYRHYLELERLNRRYLLTEAEEKLMAEKSVTGASAWNRFFDETMGAARYALGGDLLTQEEILSKLHESDRELRKRAAEAFTEGLVGQRRTVTYIFNTLLADKAANDRIRGFEHWLKSRNIANEVEDATVEALIEAVTSRYELVGRFYRLKGRLLGLDEMMDYDRYAPVGEADRRYSWEEARTIVLDAYDDFHPTLAQVSSRFFDERWIDAPVIPGKRGGAFSHGAVPSVHPYVLMNYTGKIRDVQTLAHELGHGVHQYLSRKRGVLQAGTPLTTAETASVFGEQLVFQRLMARETDDRNRLAMLVGKIDDTIATVFRQVAMNRFEDAVHSSRRTTGELSADSFSEHWIETQIAMFDGAVTLGDHYRNWWSYIPHFLHTPGYVYAYAFGELLVLALYARYRQEGGDFAERYIELLEAGGSDWPHVLVSRLGVDLTDLDFWKEGLGEIDSLITKAEELAEKVGR
jgi:oligoendopeptidase F